MKRRSKAGGEPIKGGRREAQEPKRNAPKVAARRSSSNDAQKTEVTRLTCERNDALDQLKSISEVLSVISRSKFDLQPLLQSVAFNVARLCRADGAAIFRLDRGLYHFEAGYSLNTAELEVERLNPIPPGRGTVVGRAAITRQVAQIDDAWTDPLYEKKEDAKTGGSRSMLGVPLMREGEPIGVIGLARRRLEPFVKREIELVTNFAAQAVIAIENARLLNELRQRTTDLTEALEQQTATSDVLRVISSFPGDLEPVFTSLLVNAARICDASFGNIFRWDGEALHLVGSHNTPAKLVARRSSPLRPTPDGSMGRVVRTKTAFHTADLAAEKAYIERSNPGLVDAVELGGVRTILLVPMLKEQELIGVFSLHRQEVRPFTDKQIELVENFAAQAVIAIENARLLNELRQALEQQTATSEVLQVISSSSGDLEPVFSTMLEKAVRICGAAFGNIYRWDGDTLRIVALHNTPPKFAQTRTPMAFRHSPTSNVGVMVATKAVVHVADVATSSAYVERSDPAVIEAVELGGVRTFLAVPMLKESELVGAFALSRQEVRPFTD